MRSKFPAIIFSILFLPVFFFGCGKSETSIQESKSPSPLPSPIKGAEVKIPSIEHPEDIPEAPDPIFATLLEFSKDEKVIQQAIEDGHNTFYSYGCWQCHTLGDEEAPGSRDEENTGPDLADVASRLSREFLLESMINPNAVIVEPREEHMRDGMTKMPAFNDPEALEDIRDLLIFLDSLKVAPEKSGQMLDVTENNFAEVVGNEKGLVLLDFWAEWCLPCVELSPILDKLSPTYQGRVKFCKINVDENMKLVQEYVPDIMFPCLVLLKDGKVLDRIYGTDPEMEPKKFFDDWFSEYLPKEE